MSCGSSGLRLGEINVLSQLDNYIWLVCAIAGYISKLRGYVTIQLLILAVVHNGSQNLEGYTIRSQALSL